MSETALDLRRIRSAQVPMPCPELAPTLNFFLQQLGFRVRAIFPADAPRTAIIEGHGLTLQLYQADEPGPRLLQLLCDDPDAVAQGQREWQAPNGVTVRLVHADPPMVLPPTRQALVISRADGQTAWGVGRAGMRYRDLLPERHGGAFIASHIRILEGGPVPDYVHYHKVRFQLIYCRRGWVRLVYEGQGEPFVMQAGDAVLQPPLIRHRVLESSAMAEVVEIGAPAQHITMADPDMVLPSAPLPSDHDFSGQRFVRHVAEGAAWQAWRVAGVEARDTGIAHATQGLATVRVLRVRGPVADTAQVLDSEFCCFFVLTGALTVTVQGQTHQLRADDCITLPGQTPFRLQPSADAELLEVMLPA